MPYELRTCCGRSLSPFSSERERAGDDQPSYDSSKQLAHCARLSAPRRAAPSRSDPISSAGRPIIRLSFSLPSPARLARPLARLISHNYTRHFALCVCVPGQQIPIGVSLFRARRGAEGKKRLHLHGTVATAPPTRRPVSSSALASIDLRLPPPPPSSPACPLAYRPGRRPRSMTMAAAVLQQLFSTKATAQLLAAGVCRQPRRCCHLFPAAGRQVSGRHGRAERRALFNANTMAAFDWSHNEPIGLCSRPLPVVKRKLSTGRRRRRRHGDNNGERVLSAATLSNAY